MTYTKQKVATFKMAVQCIMDYQGKDALNPVYFDTFASKQGLIWLQDNWERTYPIPGHKMSRYSLADFQKTGEELDEIINYWEMRGLS